MVKSAMGHMQVFIDAKNIEFYKSLFKFLDWRVLYEDNASVSVGDKNGISLWFDPLIKDQENDYDGIGMNHLALAVFSQKDVDETVLWLREKGIPTLFNTPCHRPDFSDGPDYTYYQVMFESPDRILFEVVYTGPFEK